MDGNVFCSPGGTGRWPFPAPPRCEGCRAPRLHPRILVRAVVVKNQMNLAPARSRSLHPLQKRQEFGVAVPRPAVADDGPVQDIKNRKQGRGAKADAIMRLVRRESWPQRQARLRSIQGLDLALLVHAQHQRLVWWVEVEPHHVSQFADEVGVPTQLEGLGAMRLQAVGAPGAA